jgi:hypothetical protein
MASNITLEMWGELADMIRRRYRSAKGSEKRRILREFIATTSYDDKSAYRYCVLPTARIAEEAAHQRFAWHLPMLFISSCTSATALFWAEINGRVPRTRSGQTLGCLAQRRWFNRLPRLDALPISAPWNGNLGAATELCKRHVRYSQTRGDFADGRGPHQVVKIVAPEVVPIERGTVGRRDDLGVISGGH